MSSNQLAAGTGIFGDFQQLLNRGMGVSEISINPFTNFEAGVTGIGAMWTVRCGVREAGAFSTTSSVT